MKTFRSLDEYLPTLQEQYGIPACGLLISRHGTIIYHNLINIKQEDLFWVYSCSKITTCTAAMQLIEQEMLCLDDPVSRYLPEYARPDGTQMTIRHLLTMTGGLDYEVDTHPNLKAFLSGPKDRLTTREVIRALGTDPLMFEPGTHYRYSLCHDVLGAVIEVVSGERLSEYCRKYIFEPLGMKDTSFSPDETMISRLAEQYCYTSDLSRPERCKKTNMYVFASLYDSGGAGIITSPEDYLKLMSALSMGGADSAGNRILKPETVRLFAAPQLTEALRDEFREGNHCMDDFNYALGVRVLLKRSGCLPAGIFGWDGAASAMALADPQNEIGIFFIAHVLNSEHIRKYVHPEILNRFYGEL